MSWSRIAWDETLPANTDVQFQLAFSNSQNGPWSYIGPDGTAGTYFTTASGETLPATPAFQGRYARFKARLSSTDGLFTPSFGNVHLSFTGAGLLASSCNNFVYDPAGNITSIETVTDAGTTVDDRNPVANPINALNQVLQRDVGGVSWLYSYDLNGNLTGKTNGTDTFIYTWSDENRLERVQGPGGLDVSYTYDTSGRMMTRTSGGVTTRLTWDGFDCVREETGSSVTIYHIPDGMLHSFSLDGAVFQCHLDALGSVRMITDASGAVVARLEYGAWGEEVFVSAIPALADFPYRFVGGLGVRTDAETGLVYMRARHYDKQLRRFISRDPIGLQGGVNLYGYAASNPTNSIDPLGTINLTQGVRAARGLWVGRASWAALQGAEEGGMAGSPLGPWGVAGGIIVGAVAGILAAILVDVVVEAAKGGTGWDDDDGDGSSDYKPKNRDTGKPKPFPPKPKIDPEDPNKKGAYVCFTTCKCARKCSGGNESRTGFKGTGVSKKYSEAKKDSKVNSKAKCGEYGEGFVPMSGSAHCTTNPDPCLWYDEAQIAELKLDV